MASLPRSCACLALLTAGLLLSGCGRVRDTARCRELVGRVNPELRAIKQLSEKNDVASQRRMADRYEALAKHARGLVPPSGTLELAMSEYVSILSSTAKAVRLHAEATERKESARAAEQRRELDRIVRREKAAVSRLNQECPG